MSSNGHRSRLKERLIKSALGELPDYEIVELILFLSNPRSDVKNTAKLLIEKFGSISAMVSADKEVLKNIPHIGDSAIYVFRIIQEAAIRLVRDDIKNVNILSSWKSLLDYARASMGHKTIEEFKVIYLNSKNIIINEELMGKGTVDTVSVYIREVAKRAILIDASSVILIHNHPSGDTKPSRADVEVTKQIMKALEIFNINLHDHLIISNKSHFSFKTNGLI